MPNLDPRNLRAYLCPACRGLGLVILGRWLKRCLTCGGSGGQSEEVIGALLERLETVTDGQ